MQDCGIEQGGRGKKGCRNERERAFAYKASMEGWRRGSERYEGTRQDSLQNKNEA
jgi:hypothetical protein